MVRGGRGEIVNVEPQEEFREMNLTEGEKRIQLMLLIGMYFFVVLITTITVYQIVLTFGVDGEPESLKLSTTTISKG